ncbi:phospholipid-translocating P-type ATPase-like protein [Aureobasidium pullulans]|uniref:Phospholipid-transporting ATPase n=1 Tax=Aureobasidium pullulans TaxID=5580 RepID=A0A4S9WN91_AURPU|nr:phospholipid-translocating P-type ATPase-like protein [Aureobasidium pullulans]
MSHRHGDSTASASLIPDADSDLDLDLDELDPQTTNTDNHNSRSASTDFGKNIALKKLRYGGRRAFRRPDRYADDADADDLEALVGRDSQGDEREPAHTIDPPPPHTSRLRRLSDKSHSALTKFKARLNPFSRSGPAEGDDSEPEDEHDPASNRTIVVGDRQDAKYPPNAVSNAKYTPVSFLPRTLYNEFSFFFNMYFLLVALSQIIPQLRIGYLSTYIFPLLFVLTITLGKEAMDDIHRRRRDQEANSERYTVLQFGDHDTSSRRRQRPVDPDADGLLDTDVREVSKPSRLLKVGDVLVMTKDQRFPADVVILKSFSQESSAQPEPLPESEEANLFEPEAAKVPEPPLANQTTSEDPSAGGEAFIRTDQLDGETDWKLRLASPLTQDLPSRDLTRLRLTAGKPDKRVNDFVGTLDLLPDGRQAYDPYEAEASAAEVPGTKSIPLSIDNTAWANTVLASSTTVYAVVIYTGPETRAALSTSASRSKTGLLENEINSLTKILCFLTLALSFILVALKGFKAENGREWYVSVMRFLILFSTIVPISLRVNLDMGKSMYAWFIERDQGIPGTVVRTSTIPEDLGRIEYLLSDKTGTLTQNEMELKKIHVGTVSYANEAMDEVSGYVKAAFSGLEGFFLPSSNVTGGLASGTRSRREIGLRVRDLVLALALCHNVTPTTEEVDGSTVTSYQASSPDEIAIVAWTEHVGLRLLHRDRKSITLQFADDNKIVVRVQVLHIFPFTSDSKRMGIIVKFVQEGGIAESDSSELYFFQKGADTVMTSIVAANDWLDEETANMAREGLRTLVIGRKALSLQQYAAFSSAHAEASLSLHDRDNSMAKVVKHHLENNLELLGVTGVEDKLQAHIKPSLELLRNAGIKIWMLTGDKVETARCVAVSSKLVSRGQYIHTIAGLKRKDLALDALSLLHSRPNAALLIDGESLSLYLNHHREAFITLAVRLPAVIACRCSPTQKADVAKLIRSHTRKRIACIGDGGNDVSMIQAADVGVGIVGKEGRQASLAADFSITQFSHLTKLLVWHGRNSYKRSAKLAQFVIHRGLIISVCQTVFSVASAYQPIALYRDWLLVGYATLYTMAPVFSLTLDRDVDENLANLYPELYKELTLGKSLSYRTFFIWVAISVYQGIVIQGGSQLLVPKFADHSTGNADTAAAFARMVSVSFTVLVINELIMVAAEITTWHPANIISILATGCLYFGSIPFLSGYFDLKFVASVGFVWRVAAISAVSLVPVYAGKLIRRAVKPPSYRKVQGV